MAEMFLNGPQGRIEVKYHHSKDENSPLALLLAPDPSKGGSMDNRVVFAMYKTLAKAGFSVLRFNYAGVGNSVGSFSDNGETEVNDAMMLLNWLQEHNNQANKIWACGYSFGSWVALQLLMRRPEIEKFLIVSPATTKKDYNFIAPYPCSGMIIQGNEDTFSPEPKTAILAEELHENKGIEVDYKIIDGANHYFSGKYEDKLTEAMNTYLKEHS